MRTFPLFFSTKYNQIKNFFKKVPSQKESLEVLQIEPIQSYSYIDSSLSVEKKIELEKRRRYQAYTTLDYLLSLVSYFDFFSVDSFKIAKRAKELTQLFEKKAITSDLLLLPFFEVNPEVVVLLEKYGIDEQTVAEILSVTNKVPQEKILKKTGNWIKNLVIRIDIPMISEMLIVPNPPKYSYEIHQIFEKAAKNAMTRFKTPVISSEILLITMLEAKKSKVGKLLKQLLKTETNWYMLRYALMKRLHKQELSIRTDVPKNQQYFAYLLKTQLLESEFDMLIEKDCLLPGVLLFRNHMIADILQVDLYEQLQMEISASIKATSRRTYACLQPETVPVVQGVRLESLEDLKKASQTTNWTKEEKKTLIAATTTTFYPEIKEKLEQKRNIISEQNGSLGIVPPSKEEILALAAKVEANPELKKTIVTTLVQALRSRKRGEEEESLNEANT